MNNPTDCPNCDREIDETIATKQRTKQELLAAFDGGEDV